MVLISSPEAAAGTDASATTRMRLLLAAMELIGEHGVEGTSLRRINELAECRNSSAVHYHFGGREKLIGAVMEFIGSRWDMRALASSRPASAEALFRLIGRSLLTLRDSQPWGYSAVRFMQRVVAERDPNVQALWRVHFAVHLEPLLEVFQSLHPQLEPGTARLRLIFALISLVNGIAGLDAYYRTALGDVRGARTDEAMLEEIIAFIAGGLTAPQLEHA